MKPVSEIAKQNEARIRAIKAAHAKRLKAIKAKGISVSNSPHSILPMLAATLRNR